METQTLICPTHFPSKGAAVSSNLLQKLSRSRLQAKAKEVAMLLTDKDFDAVAYKLLARGLGFKVNALGMDKLSNVTPFHLLVRHAKSLPHLEGLLLGQASLLTRLRGKAQTHKQIWETHYNQLRKKHTLPAPMQLQEWYFSRLRPFNSPWRRIIQLAGVIYERPSLFDWLINTPASLLLNELQENFPSFKNSPLLLCQRPGFSLSSSHHLLINTVAPLLAGYLLSQKKRTYWEQAYQALEMLPPEENQIITQWRRVGLKPCSAAQTQGLLTLYTYSEGGTQCAICNSKNTLFHRPKLHRYPSKSRA